MYVLAHEAVALDCPLSLRYLLHVYPHQPSLSLSPSYQVRFAALKVLQDMYLKLGEEFMVLLPETIPFLAECMEGEGRCDCLVLHISKIGNH